MEKMMNTKLEAIHNEFQNENQNQTSNRETHSPEKDQPNGSIEQRRSSRDDAADVYYSNHSGSSQRIWRQPRCAREGRDLLQDNLGGLKIKIPPFHGKNDSDSYLDWEKKIELVFNCQHYTEINRVKVAATNFYDYALSWWDQIIISRRHNGEFLVEIWS